MPFTSSEERKRWLPRYLAIYNSRRCKIALEGRLAFNSSIRCGSLNDLVRKHN
jgi:hypothetical protein